MTDVLDRCKALVKEIEDLELESIRLVNAIKKLNAFYLRLCLRELNVKEN